MDGTQAIQIRSLLLEAADAIDRANAIVSALDSDERDLLATPLDEISSALHFELLQKLYLRYPGLAEEGEGWDGMSRPGLNPSHRRQQPVAAGVGVEPSAALPLDRRTARGR